MSTSWMVTAKRTSLAPGPVGRLGQEYPTMMCTWADLDGLHCGRAPGSAPGATHLWGWDGDVALLARLERSEIVAGTVLRRGPGDKLTVRPLLPWRADRDRRVRGLPPELVQAGLVTLEAPGPLELLASGWTP